MSWIVFRETWHKIAFFWFPVREDSIKTAVDISEENTENQASINGRLVKVRGQTILQAATDKGISIPSLCYADGLAPIGGCRLCVVQVAGEERPSAACHTPLLPGMEILTHHVSIEKLRRETLRLYFESGKLREDQLREGLFADLAETYGIAEFEFDSSSPRDYDESHPFLWFARDACINCRICVSTCEQVEGRFVFGLEGRGSKGSVIAGPGDRFIDADCSGCGACVESCPTAAITDVDRRLARIREEEEVAAKTQSVCGLCSVGCRIEISAVDFMDISSIRGVQGAEVNRGHLCEKGQYGHQYIDGFDRLTHPMIRSGDGFRRISWGEAIGIIAGRLSAIRGVDGADKIGGIIGGRVTTESAFLFAALFRNVLNSANVDAWLGKCRENVVPKKLQADFSKIDAADLFVVIGANPIVSQPVLGARMKQKVLRGAKIVVIDPRRTEMADYADLHLSISPGEDLRLWEKVVEAGQNPEALLDANLKSLAGMLGEATSPLVIFGAHTIPKIIEKIEVVLGDRAPGSVLMMGGQANARGVRDVISPFAKGLTAGEMITREGQLKALWLVGCDPVQTGGDYTRTTGVLDGLDFLIVQDLFLTETAKRADILLPAAAPLEQEGTMVNAEGRLQLLRRAVVPLEKARPDWFIITQVAEKLGIPWPYQEPGHILDDISQNLPELFPGISYEELAYRLPDGVLLPKPGASENLTSREEVKPSPDFPFQVLSQRRHDYVNAGSFTRRTNRVDAKTGDLLSIHPIDADGEGVSDGEIVILENEEGGQARGIIFLTDRVQRGMLFLSNHFPRTQSGAIGLTSGKSVAVRLRKAPKLTVDGHVRSEISELIDVQKRYRDETGNAGYESGEREDERRAPAGIAKNDSAE